MPVASEEPATAEAEPSDEAGDHHHSAVPVAAGLWGTALLSVLFAWWAWKDGAYFGNTLLLGLIALCAGTLVMARFASWRVDLRHSPPAVVALGGLVLLGFWSLASTLWSPAPDTAVADGQRILTYALCFGLGLWICSLLGRRSELALLPLTVAGAFAGGATIYALLTGDDPTSLLESDDGTLTYPLDYRNANAAFFAIVLFPAIGLASNQSVDWRVRGLAVGTGTTCLSLFLFTQSRASLPALVIAAVIFLLASPLRLRSLIWLVLGVVPALAVLPAAIDLHAAGSQPLALAVDELRVAGRAAGLAALASIVIGMLAARFGRRILDPGNERVRVRGNRAVAAVIAVLAVAGAALFVARVGDPVEWVEERADEFRTAGYPDLRDTETRFGFNVASGRYDIWRVALDETTAAPLLGTGGGGFQYAYMRDRQTDADLRDAHSIELETLSELGIPGFAMLVLGLGGAFAGAWRSRRAGPAAAGLTAVALGSGSYWILHSSVDWFWPYPAISATVLALLGAACAPAVTSRGPGCRRSWRIAALVGVVALALSAVPPLLAERYVDAAYEGWRVDRERAYEDLDRASSLNPLSEEPLLAEGAIARADGDTARALEAFREAADQRPEEWAAHYYVAVLSAPTDRELARAEAGIALELNPNAAEVRKLALRFGFQPPPLSYEP